MIILCIYLVLFGDGAATSAQLRRYITTYSTPPGCRCVAAVVVCAVDVTATSLQTREYCVYERFTARCEPDHVIIVRSALYGRMRARRCITSDYANALGCYSDVTQHVDALCSGRQNCSLLVATMDSVAQPCAKDFKSYLEAAYDCVPGDCLPLLCNRRICVCYKLCLCVRCAYVCDAGVL